eukprot:6187177-Pleurochrysis_carterae.AAC.1
MFIVASLYHRSGRISIFGCLVDDVQVEPPRSPSDKGDNTSHLQNSANHHFARALGVIAYSC